jgi:hypothetical protein
MLFPYKAAQAGQLDVERNEVLDNISSAETKRCVGRRLQSWALSCLAACPRRLPAPANLGPWVKRRTRAHRSHPGWLLVRSADGRREGFVPQNHTKSAIPKGPATAEAVFGVPLRELLTRPTEQGDVPQVVLEMLERLEELGAARQDGMPRVSPSAITAAHQLTRILRHTRRRTV